jgi:LysR family transcriptional regulator for bpeEF and oprC
MDIKELRTFQMVVELKNMTEAGDILGLSASTVSRQISHLEAFFGGMPLFERLKTEVKTTEEGDMVSKFVCRFFEDLENLKSNVMGASQSTSGSLKMLVNTSLGIGWVSSYLNEFQEQYPDIHLKVVYDDRKRPFELSGANTGVYMGLTTISAPKDTPFIWKKLGSYHLYPYAHPDYLAKHSAPETMKDLDNHKLIEYDFDGVFPQVNLMKINHLLYAGRPESAPRKSVMAVDDGFGCNACIKSGKGLGMLSRYLAQGSGLVEVLKGVYKPEDGGEYDVHLVYPPHLKNNSRVKALASYITEKFQKASQAEGLFKI